MRNLLEVRNLKTYFPTERGINRAVDDITLTIKSGETYGLAGESGCGKTVAALSLLRLVPSPGEIVGGELLLEGRNLLGLGRDEMRNIRGKDIGMVFQEPMSSLNPVYSIKYQIVEAIRAHMKVSPANTTQMVMELLNSVRIPDPERFARGYPHQFSGGMRQRAMIAIALSCSPRLLIADEPTTALDVTIQAEILRLFAQLKKRKDMSILFITHDLGVMNEVADRVAVMYAGKIVEEALVNEIFKHPLHPYTEGLLECLPRLGKRKDRFQVIPGNIPDPINRPSGCPFHPRCKKAKSHCEEGPPNLKELTEGHFVSCWEARA